MPEAVSHSGTRVIRNVLGLYGAEIAGRVCSYLALFYLSRAMDLDPYGQYALVVNLVGMFASFGDLGLNALTVREVAADKSQASRYLRAATLWRFLSSLLFLGGLALWGFLAHYEPVLQLALIAMGVRLIFDGLAGGWVYLLQAHEEMVLQGWIVAVGSLVRFLGLVAVVGSGGGVVMACAVWSLVSAATMVWVVMIGLRHGWGPFWPDFQFKDAAGVLRASLPLAIMGSLQMLYYRVDVVMIKSFLGNTEVALYANAYKLLEASLQLGDKMAWALLPALAFRRTDPGAFGRLAGRALKVSFLGGVLTAVVGSVVAPELMPLLFGQPYAAAQGASRILFLSAAPFFVNALAVAVMTVRNPRRLVVWYSALFATNVVLNLWFIPRYGIVGSAYATLLCECLGVAVAVRWVLQEIEGDLWKDGLRWVVGALAGSTAVVLGAHVLPGLQWLVLGPVAFILSLVGTKTLGPEDWGTLRRVFGRP